MDIETDYKIALFHKQFTHQREKFERRLAMGDLPLNIILEEFFRRTGKHFVPLDKLHGKGYKNDMRDGWIRIWISHINQNGIIISGAVKHGLDDTFYKLRTNFTEQSSIRPRPEKVITFGLDQKLKQYIKKKNAGDTSE